jgi:type IV pilus assembly protein PilB
MSHLQIIPRLAREEALARSFSAALNLPYVQLDAIGIDAAALDAVSPFVARRHTCLPIRFHGRKLVVAMSNPLDLQAIQDVQFAASRLVEPVLACRSEILKEIERHYAPAPRPEIAEPASFTFVPGANDHCDLDHVDPRAPAESAPAVHLCREILLDALAARASDIHIEAGPQELRVRLRVDGVLRDHLRLPQWMHAGLLSRVKILANLDIAQQRLPQDGRITATTSRGHSVDLRVSTLPTQFGEKAVLRLLGSAHVPTLTDLGLCPDDGRIVEDALSQPQGLIVVTGPTGSGKSTLLHAMVMARSAPGVNVVTIEDPIEYQLPNITQVQVDTKTGLTFASCLRAVLRQDPDVILVGEIRDAETAEVAYQAALTGHLVLTTLHTNGSLAAVDRLLDLSVRPVLITSATNLIVAQRLARRVCNSCREPYSPSAAVLQRLQIDATHCEFQHGRGCAACSHTGYLGRIGIFEVLQLTAGLRDLVNRRASEPELKRSAGAGQRFLLQDALEKVREGLTTVEEVVRVIRIDAPDEALPPLPAKFGRWRPRTTPRQRTGGPI